MTGQEGSDATMNGWRTFLEELDPDKTDMVKLTRCVMTGWVGMGKTYSPLNRSEQDQAVREICQRQKEWGLLPTLKEKPKKSNVEAQEQRLEGNNAYRGRDLMGALKHYTRAICCAESGSEEMSMAFGNRSAVTYELEEYQNSINDINRALSTGKYPTTLAQKLFERRGKCFLALHQYAKASEDFRQAILLLQPGGDSAKMESVKGYLAKCKGKGDIPVKSTVNSPKLTHKPSSYIQSASSAVEIRFSTEMGRHLVATTDIAPGDILAIEKPFVSTIDVEYWEILCDNCKKRCHSSIPCGSCNNVVFCSEQCRETSWKLYHAVECNILHNLTSLGGKKTMLSAIRMLLKATKMGENLQMFMEESEEPSSDANVDPEKVGFVGNMYPSDHYKPIHNLITHKEDDKSRLCIAVLSSCIVHILKEQTTFFDHTDSAPDGADFKALSELRQNHLVSADLLMKYQTVVTYNAYDTQETRWYWVGEELHNKTYRIGEAVYAFLSLKNHSCDPNSNALHYDGDTFVLFASKLIKKGDQIFGSYCDTYTHSNINERQTLLYKNYRFTCKCTACIEGWPLLDYLPAEEPNFLSTKARLLFDRQFPALALKLQEIICKQRKVSREQFQHLVKSLTFFHKYIRLPWRVYYECQQAMLDYLAYTYNPYILRDPESR